MSPSDFVALVNQTLEFALPGVMVEGEVTNFKISKGRWVYFDIADEGAKIRCFGTVYALPAPVENGMVVRIGASPRLHPQFGFSLNFESLQFSGEGVIKKAADLLFAQLEKEGLFAAERKRTLPYPPQRIGLITSAESAAYKDFIKVLGVRYGGIAVELADVTVQGETAPGQIVRAIEYFNKQAEIPDVLVIIRGGGSADDLQAFSAEQVVRTVAASRIPTMVAIGHEVDTSLAELAADQRASTPSNAAELLVPDRGELLIRTSEARIRLMQTAENYINQQKNSLIQMTENLHESTDELIKQKRQYLIQLQRTLEALSPQAILKRGYSIVRLNHKVIRSKSELHAQEEVALEFSDGNTNAKIL